MTWNLVNEACIPVVSGDGGRARVSLTDAFADATSIRGLDWSQALAAPMYLRILVAIHLHATGGYSGSAEWSAAWRAGTVDDERLRAYLATHRDRFDLFDADRPFLQAPGLSTPKGETRPVTSLIQGYTVGNNVTLFSPGLSSSVDSLAPAEALDGLVTVLGFDVAGIKPAAAGDPQAKAGKVIPPTSHLGALGGVFPEGRTLAETILLNCPLGLMDERDRPAWAAEEPPGPTWTQREPLGILDLLTWPSRRVRLIGDDDRDDPRVIACVVCAGDRLNAVPAIEPHTRWRQDPKAEVSQRALRHQPGRQAWRGLTSFTSLTPSGRGGHSTSNLLTLIARHRGVIGEDYPLDVRCVGVEYGTQSAVVESVMVDSLPLPVLGLDDEDGAMIRAELEQLAERSENLRRAAERLQQNIRFASGGEAYGWDEGSHLGEVLMARIDRDSRRVLRSLQSAEDDAAAEQAMLEWETGVLEACNELARQALADAPPRAILGRQNGATLINTANAERFFRAQVRDELTRVHRQETTDA